jgi:hypothetical protein
MKQLNLKITGTSPLLLSCDKLANPILPETKAHKTLTSKRLKTDDDHDAIAKSQWNGLMYWDEDKKEVYLPSQNIRAALVGGAKLNKLGMQVKRGTLMLEEKITLDYGKKLTKVQLWDQGYIDSRSVVVSSARVICYRPKFPIGWSLSFALQYDETILDEQQLIQAFENAGAFVGIGGFRPEKGGVFGRFDIAKVA